MRRSVMVVCAIFLAMVLFVPAARAADVKMGYVDLSRTFDEYKKTQDSDSELEGETKTREGERQKLVDEIKKLKEEMVLLSDKKKDEQQAEIDDKIKALQDFDKDARDTLREARDEMVRDILSGIDKVIQEYGKENGYTVILNKRVLLYGEDTMDITQDIIDVLNAAYKKN